MITTLFLLMMPFGIVEHFPLEPLSGQTCTEQLEPLLGQNSDLLRLPAFCMDCDWLSFCADFCEDWGAMSAACETACCESLCDPW